MKEKFFSQKIKANKKRIAIVSIIVSVLAITIGLLILNFAYFGEHYVFHWYDEQKYETLEKSMDVFIENMTSKDIPNNMYQIPSDVKITIVYTGGKVTVYCEFMNQNSNLRISDSSPRIARILPSKEVVRNYKSQEEYTSKNIGRVLLISILITMLEVSGLTLLVIKIMEFVDKRKSNKND